MTANRVFAAVFIFVLFFLSISTVSLAFISGDFTRLPTMLWEEEFFAKARAEFDKAIGIVQIENVYVCEDSLIKITPESDEEITNKNITILKNLSSSVSVPTYTMIVPTANVILQNKLPKYASIWDQNEYINEIYTSIVGSTVVIPTYDTLFVNNTKYIYYRTSDNLTPIGGYYLYKNLSQKLGFYPQKIDDFNVEFYAENCFGELFDITGYRDIESDDVMFYRNAFYDRNFVMNVFDNNGNKATYNDIFATASNNQLQLCYPGGTFPVTNIQNNLQSGRKLLIIGDETVKAVVGFLVDNYEYITIVNPFSDTTNYSNVLKSEEYDQILLMFDVETFGQINLDKILQVLN